MAICYVDDTSVLKDARPVMHWLLANAYVFLVCGTNLRVNSSCTALSVYHFYFDTFSAFFDVKTVNVC